jgi:hypothetical protein
MLAIQHNTKAIVLLEECCMRACGRPGMVVCYACHELVCLPHMQRLPKSFKEGIVVMCADCANRQRESTSASD